MANFGPWCGPKLDAEYAGANPGKIGDVIEVELQHDAKTPAGAGLLVVLADGPNWGLRQCRMLEVENAEYRWWLFESQTADNPGLQVQ